jgi:hypothetical protein
MTDFDDDSGWLVNEPINPFASALNDEGEEVGLRRVHFETKPKKNVLDDVLERIKNFINNIPAAE